MANSISYAQKFLPVIDEVYKASSITEGMDSATKADFSGTPEVKVMKVSTTGLGDYSRATGFPKGDVTVGWETMKLLEERGKEISVDRMDDEETLGKAFGEVTGRFLREHVVPELDAYRFSKYAGADGILTTAAAVLTKDTIVTAIDEAVKELDANEVPNDGRTLYINSDLKPILNSAFNRQWGNDDNINTETLKYNGMPVKFVPKSRFYTTITLNSGVSSWGFTKGTGAAPINFMIIYSVQYFRLKNLHCRKYSRPMKIRIKMHGNSSLEFITTHLFMKTKQAEYICIKRPFKGA